MRPGMATPLNPFKGAVAKFGLFFHLPTNLSEICTQYVKLNQESIFAISFIYLIFSANYLIFFLKKHLFTSILKRIEVGEFS